MIKRAPNKHSQMNAHLRGISACCPLPAAAKHHAARKARRERLRRTSQSRFRLSLRSGADVFFCFLLCEPVFCVRLRSPRRAPGYFSPASAAMSSTGGGCGLPPPTTSATAARVQLRHRRSNSVGCSRSLSLLMAACGDILSQQQRAEQLVGMMGERPAPLPVSVVDRCLWSMAEPNLDLGCAGRREWSRPSNTVS